ncbi:MAG TPA: DUF3617 family protein [Thermoanaerobaculia bacterium]|jgi:hypothetical protein|nr:DUF3617 family protein [Thermoanaerobaculia bacterium]
MRKTLLAAAAVLALPLLAGASPMKAGKWQLVMQMDMPGMPMKMPPIVTTDCVTKEDAENPKPPKAMKDSDCKFSDYKMDGNSISWTVSCPKQSMTGSGKIVYSGDTYDGSMKMKVGEQEMSAKYTGKRLGDCDK